MTAMVNGLSDAVAEPAAQPRLTEAGANLPTSLAQTRMSPKRFCVVVIINFFVYIQCSMDVSKILFRSKYFLDFANVELSFIFDNYCSTMY